MIFLNTYRCRDQRATPSIKAKICIKKCHVNIISTQAIKFQVKNESFLMELRGGIEPQTFRCLLTRQVLVPASHTKLVVEDKGIEPFLCVCKTHLLPLQQSSKTKMVKEINL